jgi:hypothetical protein
MALGWKVVSTLPLLFVLGNERIELTVAVRTSWLSDLLNLLAQEGSFGLTG